jgi:hypothetical protein
MTNSNGISSCTSPKGPIQRQIPYYNIFKIMKVQNIGSGPVAPLYHSTDRPSLSLYCLPRFSDIVESGIGTPNKYAGQVSPALVLI